MAAYFYYLLIFIFFIVYMLFAPKTGIRLYSFSNVFYFLCFLMIGIPGFYVSNGTADPVINEKFIRGMDWSLYWLYLYSMFSATFGLLIGNTLGKDKIVRIMINPINKELLILSLVFIIIYSVLFFLWLPTIPLIDVFGSSSIAELAMSRLKITHGFIDLNPPFAFRYWRNFLQYFLPAIFLITFAKRRILGKNLWSIYTISLLFFTFFCLTFTLEKASLVYFAVSIFLVFSVTQNQSLSNGKGIRELFSGKLLVLLLFLVATIALMYKFFMNGAGLEGALSRIMRQTASNYLQILYFDESGALGLGGLNSRFLEMLGVADPEATFSKMAIREIYPKLHDSSLSGAAGGMYGTNIFFIFGAFGLPLVFLYIIVLGILDKIFSNTVFNEKNIKSFHILVAFYAIFCSWYAMRAFSSPLAVFSFDFLLNPSLILLLMFFSIFAFPRFGR
jgi:hypothetical protein